MLLLLEQTTSMIDSEDVACAFKAKLGFEEQDRPVLWPSFEST